MYMISTEIKWIEFLTLFGISESPTQLSSAYHFQKYKHGE